MHVLVRPDDVTFVPSAAGNAVITDRVFRGAEVRYTVELASGLRLPSSQPSATTVAVGTRVRAEVHLDHVVAFPDSPR